MNEEQKNKEQPTTENKTQEATVEENKKVEETNKKEVTQQPTSKNTTPPKETTPQISAGQTQTPTEDPNKPKITPEQVKEATQNYTPSEAVLNIDFKKGGVFEGIDSTGRRTAEQGIIDVNKALNRFKTLNPTASAGDIQAASEKIQKAIEHRIVKDPKKDSFIVQADNDKEREAFSNTVAKQRNTEFEHNVARGIRANQASILAKADEGFQDTLISAHDNPNLVEQLLQTFNQNFIKKATQAGIAPDKIQEVVKIRQREAYTVAIKAKISTDPYEALAYVRQNTEKIGKTAVNLVVAAENAIKSLETKRASISYSTQVKEAKKSLPVNFSELQQISKQQSIEGDAAREQTALFNKDPAKFAQETNLVRYTDIETPQDMLQRVEDVKIASQTVGKNLPILTKDEVTEITKNRHNTQIMQDHAEVFSNLKRDDLHRLAQQIGTGAEAFAITLPKGHEKLRSDILRGLSTDSAKEDINKNTATRLLYPFDGIKNAQVNKSVDALLRIGFNEKEAIEAVSNLQPIGSFGFRVDVPLPLGVDSDTFEQAAEDMLTSMKNLKEYGNGNPRNLRTTTGQLVEFDTDVKWVPTTRGKYSIEENGLPVVNEDGTRFEIDMETFILGKELSKIEKDPMDEIQEDQRAYRGLPR